MMDAAGARNDQPRSDRPRFRQDLFAELIDEHGARFIDVMDPDSGNLFRFYEVEYSLACGMDGERDVPGIVKWAQDELGLTPSQNEVRAVIQTLGNLGFIDSGEASDAGEPAVAGREAAPDLVPRVVAGKPPEHAPTDVALGAAGTSAPSRPAPVAPAPPVALGAPGAAARRPSEPVEDVALGAPGRNPPRPTPRPTPVPQPSEVSIDLSDHIAVRPDDVKEAVRASKVMSAVDMPQDLLDALDSAAARSVPRAAEPAKSEPRAAEPAPRAPDPALRAAEPAPRAASKPPEPIQAPAARAEAAKPEPVPARAEAAKPEPEVAKPAPRATEPEVAKPAVAAKATQPVAKPPVELPKPPVHAEKALAPPAPQSRTSPVLLVLLLLAVIGGGGFAVWKFVLQKDAGQTGDATPPKAVPVAPVAATPPPAPPAPVAKIALAAPAPDDITAAHAGVIETILAEKAVKAGEPLIRLAGDHPIEAEISALTREEKRLHDQLDAATKKRDAASAAARTAADADVAEREKTLATKQAQLAAKKTELAAFVLTAAADGAFTPSAKNGQKVAADDVLAKLQRDASPSATFKLPDPKIFSANASVELAVGKTEQHVTCNVAEVQADAIKVTCPTDPVLVEGADVTLRLPGTDAAGSAAAPAAGSPTAPAGAAVAGAAAAGSADVPATGSAAAPAAGSAEAPSK